MSKVRPCMGAAKEEAKAVRLLQAVRSAQAVIPQEEKGKAMNNSVAWRSSPDRLQAARGILEKPEAAQMLATLELDHPAKTRVPVKDGFDATYRLGFIEGFEHCLVMLRSLGENLPVPRQHVQSTFGSEEQ